MLLLGFGFGCSQATLADAEMLSLQVLVLVVVVAERRCHKKKDNAPPLAHTRCRVAPPWRIQAHTSWPSVVSSVASHPGQVSCFGQEAKQAAVSEVKHESAATGCPSDSKPFPQKPPAPHSPFPASSPLATCNAHKFSPFCIAKCPRKWRLPGGDRPVIHVWHLIWFPPPVAGLIKSMVA